LERVECEGRRSEGHCVGRDHALASLWAAQGRTSDALSLLDPLVVARPWSAAAADQLADLLDQLSRGAEANQMRAQSVRALQTFADQVTDSPGAWLALAYATAAAGDFEAAADIATHVTVLAPAHIEAWRLVGVYHQLLGHQRQASRALETVDALLLDRAEAHPSAERWTRLARHRLDLLDDIDGAVVALEQAQTIAPNAPTPWFEWCRVLEKDKQPRDAATACRRAVDNAPLWTAPRRRLARLSDDDSEIADMLRALLLIDPRDATARLQLTQLWVRTDRVADAAALMVAPLAWEGPNGVELVRALAWIQQAGGMGVAHRIRRWLGARWLQADAGWHLAEARHLREHGDWDGAVRAARHAVRLSSDARSEERRVGKEWRSQGCADEYR